MGYCNKYFSRAILSTFLIFLWSFTYAQRNSSIDQELIFPDTTWMQYASPEEAGWSTEGIEQAQTFADSIGSKAVILIYNGAIVTEWGYKKDIAPIASIRKSLFSALMGIAVEKGTIDTTLTLAELGIDDKPPLTEKEKQARVIHLLTTSSGVYHKAAGESPGIQKPKRGSAEPGEQWYNNSGGKALCFPGDLNDLEVITRLFDFAEEEFGPVEILVNNAAHCELPDTIKKSTHGSIERHFKVNVEAAVLLMKELASRLEKVDNSSGRIINISTDAAQAFATQISYGASKAAIEAYTRSVAIELGPDNITVNCIAPGPIQTGWIDSELEEQVLPSIPLRRVGYPEDIADCAIFLASKQARWITGQVIKVSGGHAI